MLMPVHSKLQEASPESLPMVEKGGISTLLNAFRQSGLLPKHQGSTSFAACLPSLLEELGWRGDARQLHDALPHHENPFCEIDLYNVMAVLGYRCKKQHIHKQMWNTLSLPALYLPAEGGAYMLLHRLGDGIHAFDAEERRYFTFQKPQLHGALITFEKIVPEDDEAERHARNKVGMSWFQGMLRRFRRIFWYTAALSVFINMMALAVPLFVMIVYDKVIGAQSIITLPYLLVGILGAIALEGNIRLLRTRLLAWFGARINILVSTLIFERLLYLSPTQTERAPISSQLARIKAFEAVRDFFTGSMFVTLLELPFVIVQPRL